MADPSGFDYWGCGAVLLSPSPKHTSEFDYWGRGAALRVVVHIPAFASTGIVGTSGAQGLAASTPARTATPEGATGGRGLAATSGAHASAALGTAGARGLSSSTTDTSHMSAAIGTTGARGQAVTVVGTTGGLVPGSLGTLFVGI